MLGIAPAHADEKADAILKEVDKAAKAVKTLTADLSMSQANKTKKTSIKGKIRLKRPNMAYIEVGAPFNQVVASDGKNLFMLMTSDKQYQKMKADANGRNIGVAWALPISAFFDPATMKLGDMEPKFQGTEKVDGITYQVIEFAKTEGQIGQKLRYFINPDHLVTRLSAEIKSGENTTLYDATLTNVKAGQALKDATFAYTPPKDAKLFVQKDPADQLLPAGSRAPEFSVETLAGPRIALSTTIKDKKAVLVNFWFYN